MRHKRTIYLKLPIDVYYEKDKPYVIVPDRKFQEKYGISFPTTQGRLNHSPRTLKEIINFGASLNRYNEARDTRNWQIVYNLTPVRFHTNKIPGSNIKQPLTSMSIRIFGYGIWLRKSLAERRHQMVGGKFIPFTDWNISWINGWKHIFRKLPEINSKPYNIDE